MQIKVEIVGEPDNVPSSERKSITVETHARRGDTFNILKSDAVLQNTPTVFTVPSGGRLVLTTPEGHEQVVMDNSQSAAIRPAAQDEPTNVTGADKPKGAVGNPAAAGGTDTSTPRGVPQAAPQNTAPANKNATEAAKAAAQTAPRPAGEKAPLPGSPVGSPPAGNEGKDNK
jgi:hypothetical protein